MIDIEKYYRFKLIANNSYYYVFVDNRIEKISCPYCRTISLPISFLTCPICHNYNPLNLELLKRSVNQDVKIKLNHERLLIFQPNSHKLINELKILNQDNEKEVYEQKRSLFEAFNSIKYEENQLYK